jgi:hypothetical protein
MNRIHSASQKDADFFMNLASMKKSLEEATITCSSKLYAS